MAGYDRRRIADAIHATIRLGDREAGILETRSFQRLRNVKQLGLVNYVFPGGDFSRLSHSLGVLHVAGEMLNSLANVASRGVITDDLVRDLRMAALVHDVGHLPFSHTMEHAVRKVYSGGDVEATVGDSGPVSGSLAGESIDHEEIGALILEHDPQLSRLLSAEERERIGHIIQGDSLAVLGYPEEQWHLGRLISSDLDADRIDYLMRTAAQTGLPYGGVDLPYLLSQITLDSKNQICFPERALPAVDHCVLGRYFDRVAIAFHKTVAGFEMLLDETISDLIRAEPALLEADRASIEGRIRDARWADFDDGSVVEFMRTLRDRRGIDHHVKLRLEAVLNRVPPRIAAQLEYLGAAGDLEDFRVQRDAARALRDELNGRSGDVRWYLWELDGFTIKSIAAGDARPPTPDEEEFEEESPKEVLILRRGESEAVPLREMPASLVAALGDKSYYALRLYALSPATNRQVALAGVKSRIKAVLKDSRWRFLF